MDQGVGHEVKRLREQRDWSQAKLAVEAEMSVSGVSMIENGQRNLTTTTLAKLANAFESASRISSQKRGARRLSRLSMTFSTTSSAQPGRPPLLMGGT